MRNHVLAVCFLLFCANITPVPAYANDLIVDFGSPLGPAQRKATGFEWIFPMNVNIMRPFVNQLKPYVIKDPWGNQQVAKDMGATKVQWLIGNSVVQGHLFIPWQEPDRWVTYVKDYITNLTPNNETYEWIIWQEPDSTNPDIWQGTQDQFFETWRLAVQTIRSIRPNDTIIGPSPEKFNIPLLKDFLIYAKANNVLPDVLSWHELTDIGAQSANAEIYTPDLIPSHVNVMKQYMHSIGVSITKFDITEYQGYTDNYRPGPAAAFIADIEAAGISGTKGNWADATQIEGLVTHPDNPQPRSIWWVYRRYAEITGTLYVNNKISAINGLGGYDQTTKTARVLVGSQGGIGTKTVTLMNLPADVTLGGKALATVEKIPNSEKNPLLQPVRVQRSLIPVTNSSATVTIPDLGTWDAAFVTLNKPPILAVSTQANTVTVHFNYPAAETNDWIAVYSPAADDRTYLAWKWLNNTEGTAPPTAIQSGSVTFPSLTNGTYEVRYMHAGNAITGGKTTGVPVTVGSVTTTPLPNATDLNGDGTVNDADYRQLKADFDKSGTPGFIPSDITRDGRVDIFDYNILMENITP